MKFIYIFLAVTSLHLLLPVIGASQNVPITIRGQVTDQNGAALSGVTVNIKGTNSSTTTNASGNYSLPVTDKRSVVVYSFVGLTTQEILVRNQTQINITLQPDSKSLEDVVVTALNIKRNPRSLGYSVVQLDGSKVNTVQTPSLVNALSGKVAGVDVGNIANGVAGTKRIVIRGQTSLTGNNQPLWVVDGITINTTSLGGPDASGGYDYGDGLTGINPDDIESISVLKGNAAAALYGSRASNGVILVTTKSGRSANGKLKLDFSSSILFDKLTDQTDFQNIYGQSAINQVNSTDLPTSSANAMGSDSWGHKLDGTPAIQFDGVTRPFSPVDNNYGRFFNTGNTITNTIGLSGSSKNQDYRVSLSDLRNTDIIPNAGFTRTSINTKAHSKFGKLDADIVMTYIFEKANNRPYIGGNHDNQFYSLLYLPNSIDINTLKPGYDSTGRELIYTAGVSNPYYIVNKEKELDTRNRFTGSVTLKYQFTNWLYLRGRMTRDYYLAKRLQYIPDNNLSSSFPYNGPANIGGTFDQRSRDNTENNYEAILGITPNLKGKFGVNGFVGGNILWRAATQLATSGNTFVVPGVYTFNNIKNKIGAATSDTKQRTNSLFGSMELSYNKYVYLTLTARNDYFSTLPTVPKGSNNLLFPSAALSFIFSDAFKLPQFISFGKFRASSAQVSGDTGPYQLDLSYSLDPTIYNSTTPLQTIGTANIPNNLLKPLLSTDYEFGLEMDFLDRRIGFDAGYYDRTIKNDIVTTAVSSTTGYATAILNLGKLENKGIEILVRATPVKTKNFTCDLTATYSHNNNKVITLGPGTKNAPIQLAVSKSGNAFVQLTEGERYGGIYGFTYTRDSLGRKVYNTLGLPVVNSKASFLGNSTYDKLFGFSNTFSYKSFSLYLFVDAKFGAKFYSETNATAYKNGKHMETLVGRDTGLIADGVSQTTGLINTVRVASASLSSYYNQIGGISEQFIYDGSFVKMREVAFAYRLPIKLIGRAGFTNATISLVARNLFTIYKDKNLQNVDPESSVASGNAQGIERLVYPTTRNYGVTLKFGL